MDARADEGAARAIIALNAAKKYMRERDMRPLNGTKGHGNGRSLR